MAYAHASPNEHCAKCNDIAARIIGTQPLCLDHFANLVDHCRHAARRTILTPKSITPDGLAAWAELLEHGITIGAITKADARDAWNKVKDFAA